MPYQESIIKGLISMSRDTYRLMVDEWAFGETVKHCKDLGLSLTEAGVREIVGIYIANVNHRNKDSGDATKTS